MKMMNWKLKQNQKHLLIKEVKEAEQMENLINNNAAEIIPFKNHKQKFIIAQQEIRKGRYVEVWDRVIYWAKKWEAKQ